MNARSDRSTCGARAPRTGAPWSLRAAAFLVLAGAGACTPSQPEHVAASHAIERLAFVPPGHVELSSALEVASEEPLLVSAFELTRGEWRTWYLEHADQADVDALAYVASWDEATRDWPASFLSLEEARRYAGEQGMRLLRASEWLRIACGSAAAPYPWGQNDVLSVANTLEFGLRQPTAVGTFEQGRSPLEIYDLVGNVYEWVDAPIDGREALDWAMGGSFLTLRQPLFDPRGDEQGVLHLALDARHRAIDIGVRLCVNARTWLVAHAAELARLPAAQARLGAVGARWGPAAVPLLEELVRTSGDAPALRWLLAGARR